MGGVLLVTGAGRGIGAAIARAAGQRGYKVAVNYGRSAEGAKQVVADIGAAGGSALAVKADMAIEAEIAELFRTVDRTLGPVTHLVNNAGILGHRSSTAEITGEAIMDVMRTNVAAPLLCVREAVRRMAPPAGSGGAIVTIGSIAARLGGFPGYAAYAASKGAIDSLTTALAKELGPLGIRVNTVRPGLVGTEMIETVSKIDTVHELAKATVPYGGRIGRPEEIAALVLWLLSDEASYVSGSIYDVSAGR